MTQLSQEEHDALMNSMKKFADGGVPCIGIFWLDLKEMKFFGPTDKKIIKNLLFLIKNIPIFTKIKTIKTS